MPRQLDVFAEQDVFEKERAEVAKKYNVADPKLLRKVGDKWYIHNLTVEQWDNLHSNEGLQFWQR